MRGMREWILIIFFVMILFLVVFVFFNNNPVIAQTEPPIEGDWVISDATLKNDTSIQLNGNITVKEGGSLNLENVSIIFNCEYLGHYGVDVQKKGMLIIENSSITPFNSEHAIKFEVNGSMHMNNCSVEHLWGWNFTSSDLRVGGIMIYSDEVIITNSFINDTYGDCICCILASPTIANNTIRNAGDDGISCNFSSPLILGNTIEDCDLGLYFYNDSAPTVVGNTIRMTIFDYDSKGIALSNSDGVVLRNNYIHSNIYGIRLRYSSPQIVINNSIYECGLSLFYSSPVISNMLISGAYNAVYCDDFSNPTLINCSFINSGRTDILLQDVYHGNSNVTLINTTVSTFQITMGSSLTIQWFLKVEVLDEFGDMISDAEVFVNNSVNQEMNTRFVTNEFGDVSWIICTESIRYSNNVIWYNPYTISAWKDTIGGNVTEMWIDENTNVVLVILKDSDGDYVPDKEDAFPYNATEWLDSDGDGLGDNSDLDDDNDGYPDSIEIREGTDPFLNTSFPVDFDHDFDPDSSDSDDDNDGISDTNDVFPYNSEEWSDSDGDGIGDNEDPDNNANGISDVLELPLGIGVLIIPLILIYFLNKRIKTNKKENDDEDSA